MGLYSVFRIHAKFLRSFRGVAGSQSDIAKF